MKKCIIALLTVALLLSIGDFTYAQDVLPTPTNFRGHATSTEFIYLEWDKVTGADKYELWGADSTTGPFSLIRTKAGGWSYEDGLSPSQTRYYKVRAINTTTNAQSSFTSIISVTTNATTQVIPDPPGNLSATAISATQVLLSWTAPGSDSYVYYIYRSTSQNGEYQYVYDPDSLQYTDSGLSPSTTYWYQVKSKNEAGYSAAATVSVTTPSENVSPPQPPTLTSVVALSSSQIQVTWGAVSNANIYYVYRKAEADTAWTNAGQTTSTSFIDTGLAAGTRYLYQVTACNSYGESTRSNLISATTKVNDGPITPPVITNPKDNSSAGLNDLLVTWTCEKQYSEYKISLSDASTNDLLLDVRTSSYQYTIKGDLLQDCHSYRIFVGVEETVSHWVGDSVVVTVGVKPTKISLDVNGVTMLLGDSPLQLHATFEPANTTNKSIDWDSSNKSVATVTNTGLVTPVGVGHTAIWAISLADPNISDTCAVDVAAPVDVTGISLNEISVTKRVTDIPFQLFATITPANATDKRVKWTSSDPKVASVDDYGMVRPLIVGSTTITAMSMANTAVKATCVVTIKPEFDDPKPYITGTDPANNATNVAANSQIFVNFSEEVKAGTNIDDVTVRNNSNNLLAAINPITSGPQLIISRSDGGNWSSGTNYTVTIPAGAVQDMGNNPLESTYTFSFTIVGSSDIAAPAVSSTSPAKNATGVALDKAITITFNESIQAGDAYQSIAVSNLAINKSISGSTITLNHPDNMKPNTVYTVTIPSGAVKDLAGNALTSAYSFSFTTVAQDITVPAVSSYFPADNSSGVAVGTNLVLTFDQNVTAVTNKNISIKKTADDSLVGTIPANDTTRITVSGKVVTINPGSDLAYNTGYYLLIDPGAFINSGNIGYTGISNKSTWNFTTEQTTPTETLDLNGNGFEIADGGAVTLGNSIAISGNIITNTALSAVDIEIHGPNSESIGGTYFRKEDFAANTKSYDLSLVGSITTGISAKIIDNPGTYCLYLYAKTTNMQSGILLQKKTIMVSASPSLTEVSISVKDSTACEPGIDTGKFTVTRTGSTSTALNVNYTIGGTATNGTDYNSVPGNVTIPAGLSSTDIIIIPKDDKFYEGIETVVISLSASDSYKINASPAALNIGDDDASTETLDLNGNGFEIADGGTAAFGSPIILSGNITTNTSLAVVDIEIGGPDSGAIGGTYFRKADFAAGTKSYDLSMVGNIITGTSAKIINKTGTYWLYLYAKTTSMQNGVLLQKKTITVSSNTSLPSVSVLAIDNTASEPGSDTGKFTVTRTGGTGAALSVNYTIGGTAINGTDYNLIPGGVTIPAGLSSADIIIAPKDDAFYEGIETVVINLLTNQAYNVSTGNATLSIEDNDVSSGTLDLIGKGFEIEDGGTVDLGNQIGISGNITTNTSLSVVDVEILGPDNATVGGTFFRKTDFTAGTTSYDLSLAGNITTGTSTKIINKTGTYWLYLYVKTTAMQDGILLQKKTIKITNSEKPLEIIINGVSNNSSVAGKVNLTATVTGGELQKMYYYLVRGEKIYNIGESFNAANDWQVEFDPTIYPDGQYELAGSGLRKDTGKSAWAKSVQLSINTPARIVGTSPDAFTQKVGLQSPITIVFNEDIDPGPQYGSITVKNDGNGGFPSLDKTITGRKLIITRKGGDWSAYTRFTVTIPAQAVQDKAGNALVSGTVFSFRTDDPTLPQVTLSKPQSDTSYNKDAPITIVAAAKEDIFISDMLINIITPSGSKRQLKKVDLAQNELREYTLTTTWNPAELPDGTPAPNGTYLIQVIANNPTGDPGQDVASIVIDGTPPTVTGCYPAPNATAVSTASDITVTFNESIQQGSVYSGISLKDAAGNNISISKVLTNSLLKVTPVGNLANGTKYTLTIPAQAVKDSAGNLLGATKTVSFTTETNSGLSSKINAKMFIGSNELQKGAVFLSGVNLNVKFSAEVDWGGGTPGTIIYKTPRKTYTTNPLTLNVGTEFGAGGKLTVIAQKDGKQYATGDMPFEVAAPPFGPIWIYDSWHNQYNTPVTTELSIIDEFVGGSRIPTTAPIFGGKDVEIKCSPPVETTLDLYGSGSITTKAGSWDADNKVSYAGSRVPLVEKKTGSRAHYSSGASIEAELHLGIVFNYDHSSKSWQYGGSSQIGLEGYAQTPPYYVIVQAGPVPIPLYARVGAGVDANNQLDLLFLNYENGLKPTWRGEFTLNPYGKVMVGTGAADVAALEAYGKGGLEGKWNYPSAPHLKDIRVQLEAGIKAVVLCFQYEMKLWDYDWSLINNKSSLKAYASSGDGPTLLPRDYLDQGPYALFLDQTRPNRKMLSVTPSSGSSEETMQENVYPYSQPVLVSHDGQMYAFWLYDDPVRSSANRTELMWSKYDVSGWTPPKTVLDDGTADFHPEAVSLPDGKIIVAWENIKETLPNTTTLENMAAGMEIGYSIFDPENDYWQTGVLTNNSYPDHSPKLVAGDNGTAMLTWVANPENTLFGSPTKPDLMMSSVFGANGWSVPKEICSAGHSVVKSSLAFNGDIGTLIWESDEDDDLSTLEDRELRISQYDQLQGWGENRLLTANNLPDMAPQILYVENQPVLFWLKDSSIVMSESISAVNDTAVVSDMKSPGGMSFKAVEKDGGITLFWCDASADGADIFTTHYNTIQKIWGEPKQITFDDSLEHSLSGCYIDDKTFELCYNKVRMGYDEYQMPVPQETDLSLLSCIEGVDLGLNGIVPSNSTPIPGEEVLVTADVINIGETFEENVQISYYQGNPSTGGLLITQLTLSGFLNPGETRQVNATITVPDEGFELYAVVSSNHHDDRNLTNNTANIELKVSGTITGTNDGDMNFDGFIDIKDLLGIGSKIGPVTDKSLRADVVDDGVINILDLIKIKDLIELEQNQ